LALDQELNQIRADIQANHATAQANHAAAMAVVQANHAAAMAVVQANHAAAMAAGQANHNTAMAAIAAVVRQMNSQAVAVHGSEARVIIPMPVPPPHPAPAPGPGLMAFDARPPAAVWPIAGYTRLELSRLQLPQANALVHAWRLNVPGPANLPNKRKAIMEHLGVERLAAL
jgi:hypothetical protein